MAAPRQRRRASWTTPSLRRRRTILLVQLLLGRVLVASLLLPNGVSSWCSSDSTWKPISSRTQRNKISGNTRVVVARASSVGLCSFPKKGQTIRDTNGARLLFLGAENPDSSSTGDAIPSGLNHNNNNNNNQGNQDNNNHRATTTALFVLTTVPVAWGTFEVAIRYIYAVSTIPTLWLTLAYYIVATSVLVPAAIAVATTSRTESLSSSPTPDQQVAEQQETAPQDSLSTATTTLQSITAPPTNHHYHHQKTIARRGGLELGTYLFVGNLCQVVGLQTIAADRAAFLLQLTTVLVPLAQQATGLLESSWTTTMDPARGNRSSSSISLRVWMACVVALLGVGCMGLDHPPTAPEIGSTTATAVADGGTWSLGQLLSIPSFSLLQWSTGDSWIVLAAVMYTFHCIRLEGYAQQTSSAVQLAAWKAVTETAWSALAIGTVILLALAATTTSSSTLADSTMASFWIQSGQDCLDFATSVISSSSSNRVDNQNWIPALGAIVWTGLVPVAYTIAAQTYGQRRVRPVTANLIYTLQPVCTALLAYVLLHEQLGPWGYLGGTLIVGSTVLVVVMGPDQDKGDGSSNDWHPLDRTTKITGAASSTGADAGVS